MVLLVDAGRPEDLDTHTQLWGREAHLAEGSGHPDLTVGMEADYNPIRRIHRSKNLMLSSKAAAKKKPGF
jgi:hypothetical protein